MIHAVYGTTDTPHIVVIEMINDLDKWRYNLGPA
jgi:hypothetical protein